MAGAKQPFRIKNLSEKGQRKKRRSRIGTIPFWPAGAAPTSVAIDGVLREHEQATAVWPDPKPNVVMVGYLSLHGMQLVYSMYTRNANLWAN